MEKLKILIMVVQYKQAGGAGIAGSTSNNAIIRNSYNIGRIETKFVAYATLTAYSGKSQNNIFENNYYLENCINGNKNDQISLGDGNVVLKSEELINAFDKLGVAFKKDTNNINNGYPILNWQ